MRADAIKLLQLLIQNYENYFDRCGYLNSEGRKVLKRVVRALLEEDERLKKYVFRVRRRGSYEDILKLIEVLRENL